MVLSRSHQRLLYVYSKCLFHVYLRSSTNVMFPFPWVIPQEFMENFRKMREEDEAKKAASVAKRAQEEAEAEEVRPSFG